MSNKKIPLWVFLHIYNKAQHECYIEYMRGAKELYKWLAFTDTENPGIDFPSIPEDLRVPSALQGYESQALAQVIIQYSFPSMSKGNMETYTELLSTVENTITLEYIRVADLCWSIENE